MSRAWQMAAVAAAITCFTLPAVPAAALTGGGISGARILVHFSLQAGQQPENIALEGDGTADLTFAFTGQVVQATRDGVVRPLASLPAAPPGAAAPILGTPFTGGIVIAQGGTRYVCYSTGTAALTGVWRLRPGQAPTLVAGLPPSSLANGLALGDDRMLYVADSALGIIWRVPADGGPAVRWAVGPQLAPAGFLGANGIKVHDDAVWVTNTDRGTLLRIPITPAGGPGPIQTMATGLTGIDDLAFAAHGIILAALNTVSELALIHPDGTYSIVLTAADGVSNPTSAAVAGDTVYIPSAAYVTRTDPNLLLARLTR